MPSQNRTQGTSLLSDSSVRKLSFSATLIMSVEHFIGMSPGSQGKLQSHKQNLLLDFRIREHVVSCGP